MPRPLRRRDFLGLSVIAVGSLAALKGCGRLVVGVTPPELGLDPARLQHLSARQAAIATAAALALVGPAGEQAYRDGRWDPALGVDELLGQLAPDQVQQLGVAMLLFEEWTVGWTGFSSWDRATQREVLAAWRTSSLGLKRSVWGFLHAAACSSFSGTEAGWEVMDYPGPCVGTSRPPGQTAAFEWDEAVP